MRREGNFRFENVALYIYGKMVIVLFDNWTEWWCIVHSAHHIQKKTTEIVAACVTHISYIHKQVQPERVCNITYSCTHCLLPFSFEWICAHKLKKKKKKQRKHVEEMKPFMWRLFLVRSIRHICYFQVEHIRRMFWMDVCSLKHFNEAMLNTQTNSHFL